MMVNVFFVMILQAIDFVKIVTFILIYKPYLTELLLF